MIERFSGPTVAAEAYGSLEPAAGLGTWLYLFSTQTFVFSHGLKLLFGLEGVALTGFEAFEDLIHPGDRTSGESLGQMLREGASIDREFRIIRRNGSLRWVSHHAQVIRDSCDNPVFAAGIMRDGTSRKEACSARDAAEAQIKSVQRTAYCVTWISAADGETPAPRGWAGVTGQTEDEQPGIGWLDYVHEADRERTRRAWFHALETKTPYAAKYRLLCRDGIMRWFVARSEPVFDSRGVLIEWFGVAFDISDVKSIDQGYFSDQASAGPNGALVRSARALLGWSINDLAIKSGVSISSIRRLEAQDGLAASRDNITDRLMIALGSAGIEFCQVDDKGTYVRLRRAHQAGLKRRQA